MQGNSWRGGRVWIERCGEGIGVASAGASATDCSRGRKGQDWTGLDRMDLSFSFLERSHSARWPSKFTSAIPDRMEERIQRVLH